MARIHTMEDDITYERVRHLPRRTRVCSVHRQLSWACQKEIQMYEKDSKVTTNHLDRTKTALQSRYRELTKVQTSMRRQSMTEAYKRRASCPAVISHRGDIREAAADPFMKSNVASNDAKLEEKETNVLNKTREQTDLKSLPRSISMYGTLVTDKEGFNAEQSKPSVQFNRQQTLTT